jgi:hypothetical protein
VRVRVRGVVLAGLVFAFAGALRAQAATVGKTDAKVSFAFERPGLPVPKFTLVVDESGNGTYQAEDGAVPVDREFSLAGATIAKIFALVRSVQLTPEVCVGKAKNVADTGTKTLTFVAVGATSNCSYNYSESKEVQQLTAIFEGVAETMDEGRKLDQLHRYDRLGLDAEMIAFANEVSSGRALEMGTIAPCLRAIAEDPDVIERVRVRAVKLLALFRVDSASR